MKLQNLPPLCIGFVFMFCSALSSHAQPKPDQISNHYDCETLTEVFSPIIAGSVISANSIQNFAGTIDPDDGVAVDIPVGFPFDYNGNQYVAVNVCMNGWVSVGHQVTVPTVTSNGHYLFTSIIPNNVLAPFWGDHYYRSLADASKGFKPSKIQFITTVAPDPNVNADPGSFLHVFTLEWKDLNVNDKKDTNSTATFQVRIIENPLANDLVNRDRRATIEFHYGAIGSTTKPQGCSIGINDSLGMSFMNGLFKSSFNNGDSTRLSTTLTTSCWPPPNCIANTVIVFTPRNSKAAVASLGEAATSNLLLSNYPNPFKQTTKIRFQILEESFVTLKVYDLCGREVSTLVNGHQVPGNYEANFDASELPSGIYEYRLMSGAYSESRRMSLVK